MEIWKNIEGYPNYQVSNLGNVRNINFNRTSKTKVLKSCIDGKGYQYVALYKDGKRKCSKVHRLVAQAFLPNPNNYKEVNHKDEDKTNNCVDNLEWCTTEYNVNYGTRTDRAIQHPNFKHRLGVLGKDNPNSKPINQYNLDGSFIRSWDSTMDVQRKLCFYSSSIRACANGKRKTAYGFIWKYAS